MLPNSLLNTRRWGDHYKYWHNYFDKSKNIVGDIVKNIPRDGFF